MVLKLILIATFVLVFLQDYRERQVHWFLIPMIGILGGVMFYNSTLPELFFIGFAMNLGFLAILVLFIIVYARFKLRMHLLKVMGLGDLLFFIAMSLAFPTLTFIVLFVFSLVFSLVLHLYLSKHQKGATVPLAGYMSLFFGLTYLTHWSGIINLVYQF